jgi:hypothetical protein
MSYQILIHAKENSCLGLDEFNGDIIAEGIYLKWTVNEIDCKGFYVYRDGEPISSFIACSDSYHYSFLDKNISNGTQYHYQICHVEAESNQKVFHQQLLIIPALGMSSAKSTIPKKYELKENYPNPFNPTTFIEFNLPEKTIVSLKIYDPSGNVIKTFSQKDIWQAGIYLVVWDSKNDSGVPMPAGDYFYTIETENFNETKRMTLLN